MHSQVHPAAVSSKSTFISISLLFSLFFTHYLLAFLFLALIPPSFVQEALLPAGFYPQYSISAYYAFA